MNIGDCAAADACMVCGHDEREIVATRGRGFASLATALCTGCGLVSHHPLPTAHDVHAFYARKYRVEYKGGWEPKRKHALRAIRGAVARAKRLAPFVPTGGRVLDIGASSGEFTYVMNRVGCAAMGIEPNEGYAAFARRTYGVDILNAPLEEAEFSAGAFHLITLNHVFEHLVDPLAALALIRRWLADDGVLFVEVPNLEGVRKQVYNTFHFAHIWNFTPLTLTKVLKIAGFSPMAPNAGHGTSLVFMRQTPTPAGIAHRDPDHGALLIQQMRNEQSFASYVLSGAPFARRWHRLQRNLDERAVVRRYASVRAMADAVIDEATIVPSSRLAQTAA
jgi:2-polyprenyl-3-methyl-5-hydroxy-6-metoxy-1,4-benzoquinol methylase